MSDRTRRSRAGCTAASAMGVRTRELPSRLRRAVGWGRGMEHGIAGRHAGISAGAAHQTEALRPVPRPATKGWGAGARARAGRSDQRWLALRQAAKSAFVFSSVAG